MKVKLRTSVFVPAFGIVLLAGVAGLVDNQLLISFFQGIFEGAYENFGWLYQLITLALFILCLVLMFSKMGDVRIGGKDAKPKYSFWSWFAMSLTGGIGASLVSSSISQPITFFESVWGELDGYGIEAGSVEAALFALGRTFHEWSFFPYAFYGVCGVSIAYVCYNMHKPVNVSSSLVPLFGDRANGKGIASVVDALAVLSLALALVGTLGTFIGLATSCMKSVYGLDPGKGAMLAVMAVTTVLYLISSISGVDKGIKFFANLNFRFYVFLMAVFLIFGGSIAGILSKSVTSLGYWIENLPMWSFDTGEVGGPALVKWWTIYNWMFWMAFAPVTGIFLAQLSYGHTIRETLIVNWILPSVFAIVWMTIFGGVAIEMQTAGVVDIAGDMASGGTYVAIWSVLNHLPLSQILVPITLFIMLLSFSTSDDNSITVISDLCVKGRRIGDEAPWWLKAVWGVAIGLLSFLLMAFAAGSKGNDGVRYMVVTMGSILSVLVILQIAATARLIYRHHKQADRA